MSTNECKWKNDTCWNYSRIEGMGVYKIDKGVNSFIIYLIKEHYKCNNVHPLVITGK
jgi:hypothetical protein